MPLLYVWALAIGGVFISAVGAWFSVTGLAALFSGAAVAVGLMAAGLEFAKLVMTGFLYRAWDRLNFLMKGYMLLSVVALSIITSGGIYGFLSNAFQRSALDLNAQQIKIKALEEEQARAESEIKQIQALIDEIPASRITRKINITREWNPRLDEQRQKRDQAAQQIRELSLQTLQTNTKVGPLIFISKAFNVSIDTVAKYLILLFVLVFDPLAICLVVATSASMKWREEERLGIRLPQRAPAPAAPKAPKAPEAPETKPSEAPAFTASMEYEESPPRPKKAS